MNASTLDVPQLNRTSEDVPDIFHMICCDENTAICGTDVTLVQFTNGDGEQYCLVCVEMDEGDCLKCGK